MPNPHVALPNKIQMLKHPSQVVITTKSVDSSTFWFQTNSSQANSRNCQVVHVKRIHQRHSRCCHCHNKPNSQNEFTHQLQNKAKHHQICMSANGMRANPQTANLLTSSHSHITRMQNIEDEVKHALQPPVKYGASMHQGMYPGMYNLSHPLLHHHFTSKP